MIALFHGFHVFGRGRPAAGGVESALLQVARKSIVCNRIGMESALVADSSTRISDIKFGARPVAGSPTAVLGPNRLHQGRKSEARVDLPEQFTNPLLCFAVFAFAKMRVSKIAFLVQ